GMRTRAAVFAVAAAGALGSGASIASAMPSGDEGGPVVTQVAPDTSQAALQARSEALNVQYGLGTSASDATVTDASTGGYVTPTAGDGSGFSIQSPSTDEALLAGAALLMIAGAAFTVRRTSTPRPA